MLSVLDYVPFYSWAVLSTIPAFDFKATLMTLIACCDYLGRVIHDTSLLVVLALFSPSPVGGQLVLIRELWLLTRHGHYDEDVHGPAVPFLRGLLHHIDPHRGCP